MSLKKFEKIFHPELDIFSFLFNINKEVYYRILFIKYNQWEGTDSYVLRSFSWKNFGTTKLHPYNHQFTKSITNIQTKQESMTEIMSHSKPSYADLVLFLMCSFKSFVSDTKGEFLNREDLTLNCS